MNSFCGAKVKRRETDDWVSDFVYTVLCYDGRWWLTVAEAGGITHSAARNFRLAYEMG